MPQASGPSGYAGAMNRRAQPKDGDRWLKPEANPEPEADYDAWLAAEIAAGCAELDAGKSTPLKKVRKDVGLE